MEQPGKQRLRSGEKVVRIFPGIPGPSLADFKDLSTEEQEAVDAAIRAQGESIDDRYRAGAVAVSLDGRTVSMHNSGQHGHAEQRAISALYAKPGGQNQLKMLVLAGEKPEEPLLARDKRYTHKVEDLSKVKHAQICAKCLEFMHDVSANVPDVTVLLLTDAKQKQVIRTSLRRLLTDPYTSMRVPIDPETAAPIYRPRSPSDNVNLLGPRTSPGNRLIHLAALRKAIQDFTASQSGSTSSERE